MRNITRNRFSSLCAVLSLAVAFSGCNLETMQVEKHAVVFEKAPSDIVLASNEKLELKVIAKTNASDPINYIWEKVHGTTAINVSNKDTLTLGAQGLDPQCGAATETYRVVAIAGALRAEKTFSVRMLCEGSTKPRESEDIIITPNEAWIAPGEKLAISATTKLPEATLKWERIIDGNKTPLSASGQFLFEAPTLDYPCQTKEFFLIATATQGKVEASKTMSVHVQNPVCVLNETSGLTSNETTRLLLASDDTLYVGTKTGLNHFSDGRITKFPALQIITALAEVDSSIWIGKAQTFGPQAVRGFGAAKVRYLSGKYIWDDKASFADNYVSAINSNASRPEIIAADNYIPNGGVSDKLKGESLYAAITVNQLTYYGGDGGVFVYRDDTSIARFDGSQWRGKSGFLGIGSNRSVRALAHDTSGNIWIGLQAGAFEAGGLVQYRPATGFLASGTWAVPIALPGGNDVRSLAVDSEDNLWIATNNGLVRRSNDGRFENYAGRYGLPSADIRDVVYHAQTGHLWIATSQGVVRWSLAQIK
jgi:hypothetical protein